MVSNKDSEGLLILTNNGQLANLITHPSKQIIKKYRVTLNKDLKLNDIPKLLKGIEDEGLIAKADNITTFQEKKKVKEESLKFILTMGKKGNTKDYLKHIIIM